MLLRSLRAMEMRGVEEATSLHHGHGGVMCLTLGDVLVVGTHILRRFQNLR